MSNVREMIQIAFEYETKIAQIVAEAKKIQAENESLKKLLATYTATKASE